MQLKIHKIFIAKGGWASAIMLTILAGWRRLPYDFSPIILSEFGRQPFWDCL
jgi:hypothetical protein